MQMSEEEKRAMSSIVSTKTKEQFNLIFQLVIFARVNEKRFVDAFALLEWNVKQHVAEF